MQYLLRNIYYAYDLLFQSEMYIYHFIFLFYFLHKNMHTQIIKEIKEAQIQISFAFG